jgi:dynactin 1
MEKKYETAQKEGDEKANKLQQSIDEMKSTIEKHEKLVFSLKCIDIKTVCDNREHSETLEALQQELDALQNEKRELKEKLRQFTKKNLIEGIITRQSSEPKGLKISQNFSKT